MGSVNLRSFELQRRHFLQAASLGLLGVTQSPWFSAIAQAAEEQKRGRQCILLWMAGGPSQMDTFDLKPGHANGGEFKEIQTPIPGLNISEHLPKLAAQAKHLAIVRSLSTREGDHGRGTYLMRTGHVPGGGGVDYPSVGASLGKELGQREDVPNNVAIAPYRVFNQQAFGSGFLGPKYSAMTVGASDALNPQANQNETYAQLKVDDLLPPSGVDAEHQKMRLTMWRMMQKRFLAQHPGATPLAQNMVYERALKVMEGDIAKAFDLTEEPTGVREAYGRGRFGQGCLMARRLIERGSAFVEVSMGNGIGWDTHQDNFNGVKKLSEELDAGWATLLAELEERGLLETTTIIWMGEFGRTPKINGQTGRDHHPAAWTCVFAGGGIKGGQAYGKTSEDGMTVEDGKVNEADVLATLCKAVGLDPAHENINGEGRPIKLADGKPIEGVLA